MLFWVIGCQSTGRNNVNKYAESSKINATKKAQALCDNELKKDDYYQASKNLQLLHENYEAKRSEERQLWWYLDCYMQNNDDIEETLNNWVKQYPNDPFGFLARGVFRHNLAGKKRGYKWINETTKEQVNGFLYYTELAIQDLQKVIELRPKTQSAYWYLIELENARTGSSILVSEYFKKGEKLNPFSYVLRRHYLMSLRPRWGGSYEKMNLFISQTKRFIRIEPTLNSLKGAIDEDKADLLLNEKRYSEALVYFNKSLQFGEEPNSYNGRAITNYRLGRHNEALNDINKAIQFRPTKYYYHLWKYWIVNRL
jgi:tetratricopeptide (TPR) repeat protein